MPARLLTFAPMIDCECSRFLLAHYGIDYVEEPHIFGWVSVLGLWHGRTPQIPQLYGDGATCVGPRGIFERYEPISAPDRRLLPRNSLLAMQVDADWARFNGILAAATAVLAYFHLLPHRDIMIEPFCRGVPAREASVMRGSYPAFVSLFTLLLRLSPATALTALDEIRILFGEVDRRLADGRRYLVGDTLTLGDIALATAAAPLVLPPEYTAPVPPFGRMPPELQAIITELRQHPTARFVERMFRDHR